MITLFTARARQDKGPPPSGGRAAHKMLGLCVNDKVIS